MLRLLLAFRQRRELLICGVQKLILESDAMTVIQAVNSLVFDRSSASGLLWELKECLSSNFTRCHVAYIPRSCNLVSHSLAALGASLSPGTNPIKDCISNCIDVWWPMIWHQVISNGDLLLCSKNNT
jgi:hypothetical protein